MRLDFSFRLLGINCPSSNSYDSRHFQLRLQKVRVAPELTLVLKELSKHLTQALNSEAEDDGMRPMATVKWRGVVPVVQRDQ